MTKGRIVAIKRFEIHDGDGIRTTLFLKGCPLKCIWCHNPEAISPHPQIAYQKTKCISCGECATLCSAHSIAEERHIYNRAKCTSCGKCEDVCLGEALTYYGRTMSPEEVLPLLTEDKIFYECSGGGVTLSGGEPLMQPDFSMELLKLLKANDINTALDTCGYAARADIEKILRYSDNILYDIKCYDRQKHILYTGKPNDSILENLRYIDSQGKSVEIRIPLIPTINDDQIEPIGRFLSGLRHITRVKVLPFHDYAHAKYEALGMPDTLPAAALPNDEQLSEAVTILSSFGLNAVSGKE